MKKKAFIFTVKNPNDVKNHQRIDKILSEISKLDRVTDFIYDFTDLGNEIGIIVERNSGHSWERANDEQSFREGFDHGVSLENGTHDKQ